MTQVICDKCKEVIPEGEPKYFISNFKDCDPKLLKTDIKEICGKCLEKIQRAQQKEWVNYHNKLSDLINGVKNKE